MGSDFYSPSEAARILSRSGKAVTERRVRQMLQAGEIAGERLPNGRWRVEQGAVHAVLEKRREETNVGNNPMKDSPQASPRTALDTSLSGPESVRELLSRVEALSRELGRSEARLELTERTESSIREERDQLRENLEAEREERRRLQDQLERLRDSSGSSPTAATNESLRDAPEASQAPEGGFEGYGSGSGSPAPESGVNTPLRVIRGLAARLLGRER